MRAACEVADLRPADWLRHARARGLWLYPWHVKAAKLVGNWTPEGKAERAALRRDYLELTAGQRVEQAIVLSRELTRLAARGLART
jgi:hypothetical protein